MSQRLPPSPPSASAAIESRVAPPLAWLERVTQDLQDPTTAIGAFLAQLPPPVPRRPATSSSQRGAAFRQRRQKQARELERAIHELRGEVEALVLRKQLWDARALQSRHALTGSLVKLAQEYHRLYQRGISSEPSTMERSQLTVRGRPSNSSSTTTSSNNSHEETAITVPLQESFMRHVLDPDAIVGDLRGPEASLDQWRLYSKAHAHIQSVARGVEVAGSIESPVVLLYCCLYTQWSESTFRLMFPHVPLDHTLVAKMLHREVSYEYVKRFEFAADGRIERETTELDFVGGLLRAGVTLDEVAVLMATNAVSSECMIKEEPERAEEPEREEEEEVQQEELGEREDERLRVSFLLA